LNSAVTKGGWPDDWNEKMAGQGCLICAALGEGDSDSWVHVITGDTAEVFLQRRSRLPGYCIVAWRHEHIAEPAELDPDQACQYWREVLAVGRAVQVQFQPIKMNYMTLGNTVPHLHTHVVPRYPDDPAPGGPIAWQDIFSPEPVPESNLHQQAAGLRDLLSRAT
jgi:diadenosine tetraphosphate (Ap4A) HIT family hydrolase